MKVLKNILKGVLCVLLIPVVYMVVSLVLSSITVDRKTDNTVPDKSIYLSTNGVHLDIIIPKRHLDSVLLSGIKYTMRDHYISFGWGDKNFYINTPTWDDLTFSNAFRAMFLQSETLIHVTRQKQKQSDWVEIEVTQAELQKMNDYLLNTFEMNDNGMKIILENKGYSSFDDFYRSKGSYSCFKTCNSWVNIGFRKSGLKSCLWTPFDFGLMKKYQ